MVSELHGWERQSGHLLKTSDDNGVRGVACVHCSMEDSVEGDAMNERCLLVLVVNVYGD